jgi:molecular chaperone DnaK
MASDNKTLGKFILDGIPSAPRGVPQVEVTFDIDANGILKVTAQDKATGRSQNITITAASGLSKEEVERMKHEAESHAEDDLKRKALVEVRNLADNAVYAAEKLIKENGEKIPPDLKSMAEDQLGTLNQVKAAEDVQAIQQAVDALNSTVQKIGASLYQQPGAGAPPSENTPEGTGPEAPAGGSTPGGEDVVDGEFKSL